MIIAPSWPKTAIHLIKVRVLSLRLISSSELYTGFSINIFIIFKIFLFDYYNTLITLMKNRSNKIFKILHKQNEIEIIIKKNKLSEEKVNKIMPDDFDGVNKEINIENKQNISKIKESQDKSINDETSLNSTFFEILPLNLEIDNVSRKRLSIYSENL